VVGIGEASGNWFADSVSTAGDVNGDGYSDVVIGAYGNATNTGRRTCTSAVRVDWPERRRGRRSER